MDLALAFFQTSPAAATPAGAGLSAYFLVSGVLFTIGVLGFLVRKNLIVLFMSVEIMLNAVNLALLAVSRFVARTEDGHVLVFLVMALAAAETAVGLSIIIAVFRIKRGVSADDLTVMNG